MISPDTDLIARVRAAFPDIHVTVGIGQTSLKADKVVTIASTGVFPMGPKARGARWVVDVTVFCRGRTLAFDTAHAVFEEIGRAIDAGEIGHATGWEAVTLPMLAENPTSSQQHSVVAFALQLWGHYGTT